MVPRGALLARLVAQRVDVLIVGGGIVGAGIARDAAMRGLRVALVEQGDFGSGSSSKTSKLLAGGLPPLGHSPGVARRRHLERQRLRTVAATFLHPVSLLLPCYEGQTPPAWIVRTGLRCDDLLSWTVRAPAHSLGGSQPRPHRLVGTQRVASLEPGLSRQGLRGAGLYMDWQMDDARLCLANILQAITFGAICCNYIRLRTLLWSGSRICGGVGQDLLSGRSVEIQAHTVINAAGAWADHIRRLSTAWAPPAVTTLKTVTLMLPRVTQQALCVPDHHGGWMVLLPWRDYSLVTGAQAPRYLSVEAPEVTVDEVERLLKIVHRIVPERRLGPRDVIAAYAAARPILASAARSSAGAWAHRIEVDHRGLVSVLGGTFGMYRAMAQETVDFVVRRHRWAVDRCLTDQVSLLESTHAMAVDHWRDVTRRMDPDVLARLLTRYGTAAVHILQLVDHEPGLLQPVCPHHETTVAELVHAIREELADSITDVLARRTTIAWSSCQGLDALSTVADVFRRYGGASTEDVARQVNAYRRFLAGLGARISTAGVPFQHADASGG